MASSALSRRPLASNTARGHSSPVSGSTIMVPGRARPERAPGGVGRALDGRTALGRAVGVLHGAAEPLGEPGHVGLGRLVAEAAPQGVVGVVGVLGGGQDVGEGLAHVVEVGDPVAADVDQELRWR